MNRKAPRESRILRAASAALAAVILAACGSASARHQGPQVGGDHGFTPVAAPTGVYSAAPQPGWSKATPGTGSTPAPSATAYPQFVAGTEPADVKIGLGSACVNPGGSQTLTVKTTPAYDVSYDVQYADGTNGRQWGGMGYGAVPATGTYLTSWIIKPDAPKGMATVFVAVAGGPKPYHTAFRQPTFQVGGC